MEDCVVSRIINEPITVHISDNSTPSAFIWRRRLYRVIDILSWWREPSEWWDGKTVQLLLRVTAANKSTGVYELRKLDANWFLSRVLD